jgi:hypothetical protein
VALAHELVSRLEGLPALADRELTRRDVGGYERRGEAMKKLLIGVGAVAGVVLLARRAKAHCGCFDMETMIERMPENAPPKWMFRNISAIRANTERILELLTAEPAPTAETEEGAAVV